MVLVFILEFFIPPSIFGLLYFAPHYALNYPWTFITSLFLDEPNSIFQLLFDGLALFFLGLLFEYNYGSKNLIILFLLAGIFGNIAFLIQYFNNPMIAGLGSSGAISGILGALAILKPKEKIIIFPIIIPIDIIYGAIIWLLFNVIGIFYPFTNLGFSAHIGGTLFGFLYGYLLKRKYSIKKEDDIIIST
ncbi:rhomboid family intramembrane serine protease [Nanobdella aerobiophila]|uniref:rhomboid family intramembrane serine protease n=1 Tax=Nanobdella aerobiophila TaxID=2586965 RepID=UPI0021AC168D|nr:rhomboid family intramembrane serine protease [Nanobdella aerobiophila]